MMEAKLGHPGIILKKRGSYNNTLISVSFGVSLFKNFLATTKQNKGTQG